MSFGFLSRLNIEFYALAESKIKRDMENWAEYLMVIFCELYNYIKNKQGKTQDEMLAEIKDIKNIVAEELANRQKQIRTDLYWRMINFELELRNIMKYNNIELKMSDDPRLVT